MMDSVYDAQIWENSVPVAGNAIVEDPRAIIVRVDKRPYLNKEDSQWVGVPTLSTTAPTRNGVQDEM